MPPGYRGSVSRPALLAFVVYLLGGLVLGEVFPFSRFSMYADIARRDYGAVPVFLVGGDQGDPSRLSGFHHLDPDQFHSPPGLVSAMDYVVDDWAAIVRARPAAEPGPLAVEVAYDLVRVRDGGIQRQRVVVARGTAWP